MKKERSRAGELPIARTVGLKRGRDRGIIRVRPAPVSPLKGILETLPREPPRFIPPMKALLVAKPPTEPGWSFEVKWDGYRALAVKQSGRVRLFSRRARDITNEFPEVADAVADIPAQQCVLDGEVVALNEEGVAEFQLLQNHKQKLATGAAQLVCYYVFDLLNLEGRDLKRLPLAVRKKLLEELVAGQPDPLRFSASLAGDPVLLLKRLREKHIEGLIAKRGDSPYEPDRRSGQWRKIKTVLEQELVIGGYTEPQGTRSCFGALLVGYYEQGRLLFASKVGTGFDEAALQELYEQFQPLKTGLCPFANLPARRTGRWGQGLNPAEMRRCTWLKPELVCQVRFGEWTRDGGLRQPVFLGLRHDKKPAEVVREKPAG